MSKRNTRRLFFTPLNIFTPWSTVSSVNFEQGNAGWDPFNNILLLILSHSASNQRALTCSNSTKETPEQYVKSVQN